MAFETSFPHRLMKKSLRCQHCGKVHVVNTMTSPTTQFGYTEELFTGTCEECRRPLKGVMVLGDDPPPWTWLSRLWVRWILWLEENWQERRRRR